VDVEVEALAFDVDAQGVGCAVAEVDRVARCPIDMAGVSTLKTRDAIRPGAANHECQKFVLVLITHPQASARPGGGKTLNSDYRFDACISQILNGSVAHRTP